MANRAIYPLFFVSGACGLVYEIVWSRMLTEVIGGTAIAVGMVLAAFMGGMALGSAMLGRRADRFPNPLRLYAVYEVGIALAAIASTVGIAGLTPVYVALHGWVGDAQGILAACRFVAAFALVGIPTMLMGATLPILARALIVRGSRIGTGLSTLYALNTAGAIFGCLLAGFWLVGTLGVYRSVGAAVVGNLAVGALAWLLSRRVVSPEPAAGRGRDAMEPSDAPTGAEPPIGLVLWLFALSGVASFAYEIFWTRSLVFLFGNSTYAFTLMLTAFLSGIALGGWAVRFVVDRVARPIRVFAAAQVAIAATSAVALPVLFGLLESERVRAWLVALSGDYVGLIGSRYAIALAVMLVPATLIGATFPLAGRICVRDLRRTGSDVGIVYAANTLGNVVGALLPAVVLLPALGVQRGVLTMAALNLGIAAVALLHVRPVARRVGYGLPVVVVLFGAWLDRVPLSFRFPSEYELPTSEVLFYQEGPLATTKVFAEPDTGDKWMSIDGVVIGGTTITDYKQQVLAHLPKLLMKTVRTELSIGLGSGILVGESLRHAELERAVCVEIEPSVTTGAGYFREENHGVLTDPRAEIVQGDVSEYLRTTADRFDLVSADEKTAEEYASNGFSYSVDYYRLLHERLNPDGLIVQWVPGDLPPPMFRMVLRTFTTAFPEGSLWFFPPVGKIGLANVFLVGSKGEHVVDPRSMRDAFTRAYGALHGLRKYGIADAAEVGAHYVGTLATVRTMLPEGPLNTLERPRYEFFSPRDFAVPVRERAAENLELLERVRSRDLPRLLERVPDAEARARWTRLAEAESRYLDGLRAQLEGAPTETTAALYEQAVAHAEDNGNLRRQVASFFWNEAGRHYLEGDARSGLAWMERAATADSGHGEIRYYLALTLWGVGQTSRAERELRASVELDSRLLAPRRALATFARARGDVVDAERWLASVITIRANDVWSLAELATLLAEQGRDGDRAEQLADRAYRLAPDEPVAIDALSWTRFLRGDAVGAREIVERGGDYHRSDPRYAEHRLRILGVVPP